MTEEEIIRNHMEVDQTDLICTVPSVTTVVRTVRYLSSLLQINRYIVAIVSINQTTSTQTEAEEVMIEEAETQEDQICTQQPVMTVVMNVEFLSDQHKESQYTVVHALKREEILTIVDKVDVVQAQAIVLNLLKLVRSLIKSFL